MKKNNKLSPYILILIGIAIIWFGTYLHNTNKKFLETAIQTDAVITDIKVDYDFDNDTEHTVFVKFTVDGTEYDGELGEYNSSMHKNDTIKIYYNPEKPYDFKGGSVNYSEYIVMAFGAIILIAGIYQVFSESKSKENEETL